MITQEEADRCQELRQKQRQLFRPTMSREEYTKQPPSKITVEELLRLPGARLKHRRG